MSNIEIEKKGFFEAGKNELLDMLPDFNDESIKILDIAGSHEQLNSKMENFEKSVEITGANGSQYGKSIDWENINSDDTKLPENEFNCIVLDDALLSLYDPMQALSKIKLSLKDSGSILVTIPNIANYGVLYYLLMGKFSYQDDSILDKKYIRHFTLTEAVKLFNDAGFVVDSLSANFSPNHSMVDKMADLAEALGSDRTQFKDEAVVHQYLIRLTKEVNDFADLNIEKFKEEHKEAYELYANKKFSKASKIYLKILKEDENDEKALLGLAKCFEAGGSEEFTLKCYKRLVELYPTPINIVEYAHYFVRQKNHKKVVSVLEVFLDQYEEGMLPKDKANIFKIIGNSCMHLENLEKAEESYLKAYPIFMSLKEGRGNILVNLGSLEIQRGNFDEAKNYFNQAIDYNDETSRAYAGLGLIEMGKDLDLAEEMFIKSLEEDITCALSIFNLVKISYEKKKYDKIISYLEKYVSRKPLDIEMKYTLAGLYTENGQLMKSLELCDDILEINPNHKSTLDLRPLIIAKMNELEIQFESNRDPSLELVGKENESESSI